MPPTQPVPRMIPNATMTTDVEFIFFLGRDGASIGGVIRGGCIDMLGLFAEAGFHCLHGCFSSAVNLQSFENVADVVLDRLFSNAES